MTGIYRFNIGKKIQVSRLSGAFIRAYNTKRTTGEASDCIYGNHTDLAVFRFVKKYAKMGYELKYVDQYYDEYCIVKAVYDGQEIIVSEVEE